MAKFYVCTHSCNHYQIKIQNISSTLEGSLLPLPSQQPIPTLLIPISINYLTALELHMNGFIPYILFCVGLLCPTCFL